MNKKIIFTVSCMFLCALILACTSFAIDSADITNETTIICTGIDLNKITDNNIATHSSGENVVIEFISDVPLEGVYIKYNQTPSQGKLDGQTDIALNGFMHEFVSFSSNSEAVITYSNTDICDIQVFSKGTLPDYVQIWQTGRPETDLLLCATHSDDDQLFFAGLLPYYAKVKNINIRVAYFVNHYDTYNRTHELLDGLWHCGIRNYPDISPFPDGYSESTDEAERYLKSRGYEYSDILDFQKSLLDKYKPLTVVLHDIDGEYGHGAHMLNTKTFIEAFESNENNGFTPEKVYIHLHSKDKIILPIDTPYEVLDGKTPFQISQEAFRFHKSQHWTWFYSWLYGKNNNITKASQITKYSPSEYGLYFTSVGPDNQKNDILENILTYAQREEIMIKEAEEKAQIEKELADKHDALRTEQLKLDFEIQQIQEKIIKTYLSVFVLIAIAVFIITVIFIKFKKKR